MERIGEPRRSGLSARALYTWGLVLLAAGALGRGILQTRLLRLNALSAQELLAVLEASQEAMGYATAALVLQALETCAVPIFAFLAVDYCQRAENLLRGLLAVGALALASEVPYNLAMSAEAVDASTKNPAFGLLLGMAAIFFFRRFPEKKLAHRAIRLLVAVSALLWCGMLRVELGAGTVLVMLVLWLLRSKPNFRAVGGAAAAMVCTLWSPFFLASPMGFMAVHFYSGEEPEEEGRWRALVGYPVLLLAVFVLGMTV